MPTTCQTAVQVRGTAAAWRGRLFWEPQEQHQRCSAINPGHQHGGREASADGDPGLRVEGESRTGWGRGIKGLLDAARG